MLAITMAAKMALIDFHLAGKVSFFVQTMRNELPQTMEKKHCRFGVDGAQIRGRSGSATSDEKFSQSTLLLLRETTIP